jgi:hypothetical protein
MTDRRTHADADILLASLDAKLALIHKRQATNRQSICR